MLVRSGGVPIRVASKSVRVREVVDAVKIPVVAAGSIVDGRGLAAALALGAQGVWMGTRFIAS
ncbi:MAG: nitronate monooxygenase, partial [Microbacterium sp.]|nr:nitronate monooxygenase [Microbacterium sp.]